ncbi:MAG: phosphopentomutase [Planctomycetes bacterium]|nr:phosphopentomutase [Planctomycetota bacterium]
MSPQRPFDRAIIYVLDGFGVGAAADAAAYGDAGSDTVGHIARHAGLSVPNLERLGLARISSLTGTGLPVLGAHGRMGEASAGKDTTTGHWEMAGLVVEKAFPLYPEGFPEEVLAPFRRLTGRGVLGNRAASGTEIIQELGPAHQRTGSWIVYTSGDSVFQVAAHEEVVPRSELHAACRIARGLLRGSHEVGRVIARPFVGTPGAYTRTAGRRDFAVAPSGPTLLDALAGAGHSVVAVGKIEDIFSGRGCTRALHPAGNEALMEATIRLTREDTGSGLVFTNLVDFDMKYGHRRDPQGYRDALHAFDERLPEQMDALGDRDLLVITADHGCDPTFRGTDHTREFVPLLLHGRGLRATPLGERRSFADLARTLAANFGLTWPRGTSFLDALRGGA